MYVYDAFGQLAVEYSTAPPTPPCTTCYLSYDHLGSVRLVTDQSANVVARHDYLPFGEEVPPNTVGRNSQWGSTSDTEQKFTGQIHDQETGMDYFNARYYGSALGRFTSPDPANAGADPTNPQSWNAYAYVGNNPLNSVDPTGLFLSSCNWMNPWCLPGLDRGRRRDRASTAHSLLFGSAYGAPAMSQAFLRTRADPRGSAAE